MIRNGRFSAEEKLDLMRRHRQGEQLDVGADRFGRDLLAKWEGRAPADLPEDEALSRLLWTEDDGEIPSLDILREQAGLFPSSFLRPGMRILSLFSARFYGRSDVIRVYDSGAAHVTLIDIDARTLDEMRLVYPSHWSYVAADYCDYVDRVVAKGEHFDAVIADPWRSMSEDLAWNRFGQIMMITELYIVNYFDNMFRTLDLLAKDLTGLSKLLSQRVGYPVHALEVMWRNPEVAWAVFSREETV